MLAKSFCILVLLWISAASAQEESPSYYLDITPSFVTNYDEGARLKYLKARVSLKLIEESAEVVMHHMPSIKNALVILFSSQAEENLTSTVGRETLRREALEEVRQVMAMLERQGNQLVEDLYFTDFIVQQ